MSHHEHRPLEGKRVAVPVGPMFEDSEAIYPLYRLREAGAEVVVVGLEQGKGVKGKKGQELEIEVASGAGVGA